MYVVHLVPGDSFRGAQTYARALIDHLNQRSAGRHEALTLFAAERGGLRPEHCLGRQRPWRGLDPTALFMLGRRLRQLRPDVLVAHGGESLKYSALCAARCPLVYYKIGGSAHAFRTRPHRWLYAALVRRAHRVAAVSLESAREAEELLMLPSGCVVVIPNGRDPMRFGPHRPAPGGVPRLLWIGQLGPTKRPAWFIRLVETLRGEGLSCVASLVGEGPLMGALRQRAPAVGVALLGARDDVPGLLADSDLLVFTGERPEGMPGVLIEAGLSGIPVVTTAVPGAKDVVVDGETGYLVAEHDFRQLHARVRTLVSDAERRCAMGSAARQRCEVHFSLSGSAQAWERLLHEVADRPEVRYGRA